MEPKCSNRLGLTVDKLTYVGPRDRWPPVTQSSLHPENELLSLEGMGQETQPALSSPSSLAPPHSILEVCNLILAVGNCHLVA
ncbi:hypothetical protein L195_g005370 [Trifolium pratense]|uniref:Uncharacterized protein n=1 Tax=Trifolium pratense TaxID=57577 RepID=A0A2K3P0S1_TRIPR|nr:hypothetical protein L195_g005370 [Trifolium pratense]